MSLALLIIILILVVGGCGGVKDGYLVMAERKHVIWEWAEEEEEMVIKGKCEEEDQFEVFAKHLMESFGSYYLRLE